MSTRIAESQERLLAGIRKFQTEVYPSRQNAYKQVIREGQKPHALFITCADSRIDPEMLTQSGPGDIFVLRNIGNLVPAYGEMVGGVSAVVEYAVVALQVSQIVVCGHTDCGAMKGLMHPDELDKMQTVKSWLRNAEAAMSIAEAKSSMREESVELEALIDENVMLQLNHLRTHPSIAGRLAAETIALSGWVYDIGHGTVRIYDESRRAFVSSDEIRIDRARAGRANG